MHMVAYSLICLSIWSQFDDTLLPLTPAFSATLVTDDDDEYLSVQQDEAWRLPPSHLNCLPSIGPSTIDAFSFAAPVGVVSPTSPSPLDSAPLYVFMSLQL